MNTHWTLKVTISNVRSGRFCLCRVLPLTWTISDQECKVILKEGLMDKGGDKGRTLLIDSPIGDTLVNSAQILAPSSVWIIWSIFFLQNWILISKSWILEYIVTKVLGSQDSH